MNGNERFERVKGQLNLPIKEYKEAIDLEKNPPLGLGCGWCLGNMFLSDTSSIVTAVYDGTVIGVFCYETCQTVITRFGDFFVSYHNLECSNLKKGDKIKASDNIGITAKNDEGLYELSMYLYKSAKGINIYNWFKWKRDG